MTRVQRLFAALVFCFIGALAISACSGGGSGSGSNGAGFVSDNPNLGASPDRAVDGGVSAGTGGGTGAGGSGGTSASPPAGDAARVIEEADIIQLANDRLYALSRYGGLSVVDAGQPDDLRLLGRWRSDATPFEMYLRDNVVLALFTTWTEPVYMEGYYQYVQTSNVVALDVSDPANVHQIGTFAIPGEISDSRIVGNVLYVVSYENGSCWQCDNGARTMVVSLDVSDPTNVRRVDSLSFGDDGYGWGPRSVTATTQRMYVAGPEYNALGQLGSSIQIVDISDPTGDLVPGATVEAQGEIRNRWQMDEYNGVLRVVSQSASTSMAPVIQTFTVTSSQQVTPLGQGTLVLPTPEQLQSVRFDGPRAYAITFQRTDPLFTIDLSNPALPRQAGELVMPGWVYHMVPRGDRMIGVGFDQGNPAGGIHVSLFDVSDLANPTMIDRVNFGPTSWGNLAEDQNRIHKAFRILDELGLILVPYGGYSYQDNVYYCGSYTSGVQLVDLVGDDLRLRGNAPSFGEARRAFVHSDRLFTVSDDRVQSFDITNRDAPAAKSSLPLSRNVASAVQVGANIARLSRNWWTDTVEIDVTSLANADAAQGLGGLDLQDALDESCWSGFYGARMFADDSRVYVAYQGSGYWGPYGETPRQEAAVAVINVANPTAPTLEAHHALGFAGDWYYGGYGYDSVVSSGDRVAHVDHAIAFLRTETTYNADYTLGVTKAWLDVVDLSDPKAPKTARLDLPASTGLTGLHVDGNTLLTSHFEPLAGDPSRVRFYFDRIDLTQPSAPRVSQKINVPGSLFAWDASTSRAVTVDYLRRAEQNVTSGQCYSRHGYYNTYFQPNPATDPYYYDENTLGSCRWVTHTFNLVRLGATGVVLEDSHLLEAGQMISQSAVGDGRVFVSVAPDYYSPVGDCVGCQPSWATAPFMVVGFDTGELVVKQVDLPANTAYGNYISRVVAGGTRAVVGVGWEGGVSVVDASDASAPSVAQTADFPGYIEDIVVAGDTALISLGYNGIRTLDLTP